MPITNEQSAGSTRPLLVWCVVAAALLLAAACLFPPWETTRSHTPCGNRLLFDPPRVTADRLHESPQVDLTRAKLQVAAAFVIAALLLFIGVAVRRRPVGVHAHAVDAPIAPSDSPTVAVQKVSEVPDQRVPGARRCALIAATIALLVSAYFYCRPEVYYVDEDAYPGGMSQGQVLRVLARPTIHRVSCVVLDDVSPEHVHGISKWAASWRGFSPCSECTPTSPPTVLQRLQDAAAANRWKLENR